MVDKRPEPPTDQLLLQDGALIEKQLVHVPDGRPSGSKAIAFGVVVIREQPIRQSFLRDGDEAFT
jgi:hypothetical protein